MNNLKTKMFPKRTERKEVLIHNAIFVDPGITASGWAFFEKLNTGGKVLTEPTAYGQIKANSKSSQWLKKINDICGAFDGLFNCHYKPAVMILEMPEVWDSAKSLASAASGNLLKLVLLCGGLVEVSNRRGMSTPVLLAPTEWKGQLPKKATQARVCKRFGISNIREHEADALGIALAAQDAL